ncbi:heme uptake protein IsdC [Alkalihalobacillus sp. LMS39]|uniref:heme uptake protein IsdC n=1 Tax=Alkalihalobacillus sp. LMS39 TaxID=2924032 RepID=UPI001FB2AA67|nr:heme uptake protein IsdC [Alkalihalobacillus sp. LMS39]UOE94579.1 heme uptake protein IsdC [Alkalihalobacillus sp. LMS39]
MKKSLMIALLVVSFVCIQMFAPLAYAADLADGTYTINYTVLKAENDSVSMANDYWEKPAKIFVENGQMTIQMKINHSDWVTEFKVKSGSGFANTSVISEDAAANTRVVQFKVNDLSTPLESKIHVTVDSIDYDHDYTVRFRFDTNSLKTISLAESNGNTDNNTSGNNSANENSSNKNNESSNTNNSGQQVANPQTGEETIWIYVVLLVSSVVFFSVRKLKKGEMAE